MKTPDLFRLTEDEHYGSPAIPQHLIRQGLSIAPAETEHDRWMREHLVPAWMRGLESFRNWEQKERQALEVGRDDIPRPPLSHRNDPQTSLDAAVSMREVSGRHRIACVTALALYGPMTAHEVAAKCGFDHWSVAARRLTELHEHGTIERIKTDMPGVYQTRKTPSGRQACLWRVVK